MAEIMYHDPVQELHGKFSKKNGRVSYQHFRASNYRYTSMPTQWSRRERKKREKEAVAANPELRQKFAQASQAAHARLKDTAQQAADKAAFKKQSEYPTLYGYVFADEYAKL